MTDTELMEAAANAAGIELPHFVPYGVDDWVRDWNPLTDDGDALRLMMKMKMRVNTAGSLTVCAKAHGDRDYTHELIYDDLQAATRRAIVRAAAAIGAQK